MLLQQVDLLSPRYWLPACPPPRPGPGPGTLSRSVRCSQGLNTVLPLPSLTSLRHCSLSRWIFWNSPYSRPRSEGSCSAPQPQLWPPGPWPWPWPDITDTTPTPTRTETQTGIQTLLCGVGVWSSGNSEQTRVELHCLCVWAGDTSGVSTPSGRNKMTSRDFQNKTRGFQNKRSLELKVRAAGCRDM